MIVSARLFWRTSRFEILAGVALSAAFTAAALVVAAVMTSYLNGPSCAGQNPCEDRTLVWIDGSFADPLMFAASGLPLAIGLLYGARIVGGDLERGAGYLAWSLTGSRLRWVVWRAAPAALLVPLLLVGPALAATRLEVAHVPWLDPAQGFHDFGSRGPLMIVRGLLGLAFGITAGAYLGRIVPALLLGAGLYLAWMGAAAQVRPLWLPREVIPSDTGTSQEPEEPLAFGDGFRLPDGRLLTYAESASLRPPSAALIDSPGFDQWLPTSGWQEVSIGIAGTDLRAIELREGAATVIAALTAFAACLVVVRRRRPEPGRAFDRAELRPVRAAPIPDGHPHEPRWRRSGPWLSWRMAYRVGRGELIGAVVAALAVTGFTVGATVVSQELRVAGGCVDRGCFGPAGAPWAAFVGSLDGWLSPMQASLPFVVGALFGVPLIARELEVGTGRLTWALSGSRGRWLRWRLGPVVLLTIVLLVPLGVAGQALVHQEVLLDPWNIFDNYWLRGPTVVTRGLATLGVALLIGAAMRRILPGFIATALVAAMLYSLLDWALGVPVWTSPVAVPLPRHSSAPCRLAPASPRVARDGSWHSDAELGPANGFPDYISDPAFAAWEQAHGYIDMNTVTPGSAYLTVATHEGATLLLGGVAAVGAALVVLRRSRL